MLWSLYQTLFALSIENPKKENIFFAVFQVIFFIENFYFLFANKPSFSFQEAYTYL